MELGRYRIQATARHTLGWEEVAILPVGDIQLGAEGCAESAFRRHIEAGIKAKGWWLGLGDYVDVASPSNRTRILQADLYDSVQDALEAAAEDAVQRFLRLVKGTEGRWLGLLAGHHYWNFRDGTSSDTRIAKALGAQFLGDCAFVVISHERNKGQSSAKTLSTVIWAAHGSGGGQRASAPITKLESIMAGFDADVYLMGHMTKLASARLQPIGPNRHGTDIIDRYVVLQGTGGFFQGYVKGSTNGAGRPAGSYVERRMLRPVAIGAPIIHLIPHHTNDRDYVERRGES